MNAYLIIFFKFQE